MSLVNISKQDLLNRFWNDVSFKVTELFDMSGNEVKLFQTCNTAKLIGTLPFLAGTVTAERDSISNLIIYIASVQQATRECYLHTHEDDEEILDRLKPINHFNGGDRQILHRGMNLLALIMLEDYQRDKELDLKNQKYNPVLSGIWNYEFIKEKILNEIEKVPCPDMDNIISLEYVPFTYWMW